MDPLFAVCLVALGGMVGFAAGLLGIGGGMVLAPFLVMLLDWQGWHGGLAVHAAIATSMATILFTSLSSVRAHHKAGAVRWRIFAALAPGILLGGALSGGAVFAALDTAWLSLAFALFVGYSAVNMLRARAPKAERRMPGAPATASAGVAIGFVSGLVGAGGGFMSVPFMARCNVPLRNAVATSAALGFPIALANTAGYVWSGWHETAGQPGMLGYVYWPALLTLSAASVLTAPAGARASHRLPVQVLRRLFALLLFCLAAYMLYVAVTAFAARG